MQDLTLTITLASDAEPGCGIGAAGLDQLLPRDTNGQPILQASHLKGLMLDALRQISQNRGWESDLEAAVFGEADQAQSRVFLGDARPTDEVPTFIISRTAVDDDGSKREGTLRDVEALPCGQSLTAPFRISAEPGTAVDLAARLAALTVAAVGGDRNRGAGACQVTISGETRRPGDLLKTLDSVIRRDGCPLPVTIGPRVEPRPLNGARDAVLRRLVLIAEGPICCPERPVAPGNTIESGFTVPASAVQGILLTRLNEVDGSLASACFGDEHFRAWPLLPVALLSEAEGWQEDATKLDDLPLGWRAPLTHRISKLPKADGHFILGDSAIATLPENETSPGAPLRSCDGVLLVRGGESPVVWRAGNIPRVLTTHGVHRDGEGNRNLFSVLSLTPMVFSGLVSLPAEAALALDEALQEDDHVIVGKARSVRGSGRLMMKPTTAERLLMPAELPDGKTGRVFIVQSPLALPDAWVIGQAEAALAELVEDAGWPEVDVDASRADCGLRFGWNRHGLGALVGEHRRIRARRCILPGSVVVLSEPLGEPAAMLLAGIGEGREAGFGALLPHPGIASDAVDAGQPPPPPKESTPAGELAFKLWSEARAAKGPSANQISAVRERFEQDPAAALTYLESQKRRPPRVWQRWEPVYETLINEIGNRSPDEMAAALRGWQDVAVAHKEDRR